MIKNRGLKEKKALKRGNTTVRDIITKVWDARDSDIIIPVMGPTGVGKSTFINAAVGEDAVSVGHDLQSCTATIQHVVVPCPGDTNRRIVFVDTPGFDDTWRDDTQILKLIADWLAHSYKEGKKLAGIIYLHEISQTRMFGASRRNLVMFGKLCGDGAIKNVILATTKWSHIVGGVGKQREEQLSKMYWKRMLDQGSGMAQFRATPKSAWDIVGLILKKKEVYALLIQEELVDLQKRLPETEAGIALRHTLQELLEDQKEMARQLREETEAQGNAEPAPDLRVRYEETQERLSSTLNQIQDLKVPLGRRIFTFFFFTKRSHAQALEI